MTEYKQTREQCQALINGVVCCGCGGPLQPLETVDRCLELARHAAALATPGQEPSA